MSTPTDTPRWPFASQATHDHLKAQCDAMPAYLARATRSAQDMARGYAWGRMDAPGYQWPSHGGDGLDFSMAYAIHTVTDRYVHAVREAFDQWHETGVIGNG
jgi:hypothetical protein